MSKKLTEIKFDITVKDGVVIDNYSGGLNDLMVNLVDGRYRYHIVLIPSNLIAVKAKYFALVTELANYTGMQSRKDKDLFKEQIKKELGNESIADMVTLEQVAIKIEELYNLAANFYEYHFKDYVPSGQIKRPDTTNGS